MKHIKNLLDGMASLFSIVSAPRRYQIIRNGAQADAQNLAGDFLRLGNTMRRVLKNDKQADKRPRER